MSNALGIVIVLTGIALSIALHELGHFLPARRFGVKVTQFMVGFGPTLWSRRRGETEYGVKVIPLGGYIRMIGMFPPAAEGRAPRGRFAAAIERARADSLAEVDASDVGREFWRLPVRKRLVIMAGGPVMNLLLCFVFFGVAVLGIGSPVLTAKLAQVVACVPTTANPGGVASDDGGCAGGERSFAAVHGLRAGDVVTAIDGVAVGSWADVSARVRPRAGESVTVAVRRPDGSTTTVTGPLPSRVVDGKTYGFLGGVATVDYKPGTVADVRSAVWELTTSSVQALVALPASVVHLTVSLVTGAPREAQGPVSVVGIADVGGQIASSGADARGITAMFLALVGSLNLFLFLFNMLPLLPLDGGHIAGGLFEATRRALARLRGRPDPGPADTARMLPVAYVVATLLILMSAVVMLADIVRPISL
ncbi:MAG: site-2 protease family protein [Actinomycetales bacterium]|nr:site-2 protease family protein [Actinomycetales bacterium]